jgi:hypothetical protein
MTYTRLVDLVSLSLKLSSANQEPLVIERSYGKSPCLRTVNHRTKSYDKSYNKLYIYDKSYMINHIINRKSFIYDKSYDKSFNKS